LRRLLGIVAAILMWWPVVGAAGEIQRFGDWTYYRSKDKITDKYTYAIYVASGEKFLAMKCDEPGPESVYVGFLSNETLGGGREQRQLIFRIDQDQPIERQWVYDANIAEEFDHSSVLVMEDRLKSAHRIIIRAYTSTGDQVDAEFKVSGASEAIAKITEVCEDRP